MKTKLFRIFTALIFVVFFSPAYCQDTKQELRFTKQKSYSKSYTISGSDRINVENQFGEMKLITWDRNEVKVDVSITAESDDEARAQKILDIISIDDKKNNNGVSFKTYFLQEKDEQNKNRNHNYKESMKINFTVYLPASNPLSAKNQFGAMIVPDYRGEATLESQFGSLTAGKITNTKKISIQFGSAEIGQVNNGTIDIQYSSATIHKLVGDVDVKLQFSNPVKLNIDNDVKTLDVDNSYSTVYLDLNKNLSATYSLSNSYGSFTNKSNFTIAESDGETNKHSYTTTKFAGRSGNGDARISVRSSFGTVIAGHNLHVDTSKKTKSATI